MEEERRLEEQLSTLEQRKDCCSFEIRTLFSENNSCTLLNEEGVVFSLSK